MLREEQIDIRRKRAATEQIRVQNLGRNRVFSDYLVTNPTSSGQYRVSIRGFDIGDNSCDCPDFRTNTLGTCKHIEAVLAARKEDTLPQLRRKDGSLGSRTPVGPTRQALQSADAAPAWVNNEGSRREKFRGSMSKLSVSLSTLRRMGCPITTQDSLPAAGQFCRAGLDTRQVPRISFRGVVVSSPPPIPGFAWRNDPFDFPWLELPRPIEFPERP